MMWSFRSRSRAIQEFIVALHISKATLSFFYKNICFGVKLVVFILTVSGIICKLKHTCSVSPSVGS